MIFAWTDLCCCPSSGGSNRIPETFLPHGSGGWNSEIKSQHGQVPGKARFLVCRWPSSLCILSWRRQREGYLSSFSDKDTSPIMGTPLSWPNYFPTVLLPKTITLELWHMNWGGGDINIQSIATLSLEQWWLASTSFIFTGQHSPFHCQQEPALCLIYLSIYYVYILMDFYYLQGFMIHYCPELFWCSNRPRFGQWQPLQPGSCVLVTCLHHSFFDTF